MSIIYFCGQCSIANCWITRCYFLWVCPCLLLKSAKQTCHHFGPQKKVTFSWPASGACRAIVVWACAWAKAIPSRFDSADRWVGTWWMGPPSDVCWFMTSMTIVTIVIWMRVKIQSMDQGPGPTHDPYSDPYPMILRDPYPRSIPLIRTPFSLKKDWCWP